jgi:hydroxymethylglutaryl-CoA lyase
VSRPALPSRVRVVEVGPRDGLQNEPARVETAAKVAFVEALAAAGLPVVEVGAFVHPARVPQMADTAGVFAGIARRPAVRYTALVPNVQGLQRALASGADEIAIFAAASESFSERNINQGIEASFAGYAEVARDAAAAGLPVRAYLSTVFGCPYEGTVPVARVVELSERLLALGAYEVAVSDTIGVAHPGQVWDVLEAMLARVPADRVALHFHDTRGTALANVLAALQAGITTFDAAAGGLGGCPFAPGASGNLATEDLLYMLDGLGIETGVSLDDLAVASERLLAQIGRAPSSRYLLARRR